MDDYEKRRRSIVVVPSDTLGGETGGTVVETELEMHTEGFHGPV